MPKMTSEEQHYDKIIAECRPIATHLVQEATIIANTKPEPGVYLSLIASLAFQTTLIALIASGPLVDRGGAEVEEVITSCYHEALADALTHWRTLSPEQLKSLKEKGKRGV